MLAPQPSALLSDFQVYHDATLASDPLHLPNNHSALPIDVGLAGPGYGAEGALGATDGLPDDASAANALLAFCAAAASKSTPRAPPHRSSSIGSCDTVREERREAGDAAAERKTHWSGVTRPPPLQATDGNTNPRPPLDEESRRLRMNHMRRCNEDMRILMLGWTAVETEGGGGGRSLHRVYEHPTYGRVNSKKEIFRIHKGERIDFSSNEAANVSMHVRSVRASAGVTPGMPFTAATSNEGGLALRGESVPSTIAPGHRRSRGTDGDEGEWTDGQSPQLGPTDDAPATAAALGKSRRPSRRSKEAADDAPPGVEPVEAATPLPPCAWTEQRVLEHLSSTCGCSMVTPNAMSFSGSFAAAEPAAAANSLLSPVASHQPSLQPSLFSPISFAREVPPSEQRPARQRPSSAEPLLGASESFSMPTPFHSQRPSSAPAVQLAGQVAIEAAALSAPRFKRPLDDASDASTLSQRVGFEARGFPPLRMAIVSDEAAMAAAADEATDDLSPQTCGKRPAKRAWAAADWMVPA